MTTWQDLANRLREAREAAKRSLQASIDRITQSAKEKHRENLRSQDDEDRGDVEPLGKVELLGRGASYDHREWEKIEAAMQANRGRVVKSSNVYSFAFEQETDKKGILYVTFLDWSPGIKSNERSGPGPTYAYFDVSVLKYKEFQKAASASAGKAVWDYLRERGSMATHQHRYQLMQVSGDYVPRKATKNGFARRTLIAPGMSPDARRNTAARAATNKSRGASHFFKESSLEPNVDTHGFSMNKRRINNRRPKKPPPQSPPQED